MKKLDDDITEYRQVTRRNRMIEESIILGCLQQNLIHIGFFINKQYHPWSTHLSWAFAELPSPAPEVLSYIEAISRSEDVNEKLSAVQEAREIYFSSLINRGLLSGEILSDLLWAERLEGWSKDNWRDWITACQEKADAAGDDRRDFWIWSLWGWK